MAIYEFKCEKCMKLTVRSFPISSQQKTVKCEFCNEMTAKRIISVPSGYKMKGYSAKNGYSKGEK